MPKELWDSVFSPILDLLEKRCLEAVSPSDMEDLDGFVREARQLRVLCIVEILQRMKLPPELSDTACQRIWSFRQSLPGQNTSVHNFIISLLDILHHDFAEAKNATPVAQH